MKFLKVALTMNLLIAGTTFGVSKYWCNKGHFNINQRNFVQELAKKVQPRYAIETGFCTGRSTSSLLEAVNLVRFISIDVNLDYLKPEGRIYAALLEKDFPEFKLIESDSKKVLTKAFFEGNYPYGIDWATIDGDHSYKGCTFDLESIYPYLSDRGIMLIDDYRSGQPDGAYLPEVTNAVDDFCKRHPEVKKEVWNNRGKGFAILSK